MEQSECHTTAAVPDGVAVVIFHMPDTVGFQNQKTCAERRNIDVTKDVLRVNSQSLFGNKELYVLFEYCVHIHLLTLLRYPQSGIQFYAGVLIFLQNDGFIE